MNRQAVAEQLQLAARELTGPVRKAAYKVSLTDLAERVAKGKNNSTFKCPECGTKVLEATGYCVKCKKKVKPEGKEKESSRGRRADRGISGNVVVTFKACNIVWSVNAAPQSFVSYYPEHADELWNNVVVPDLKRVNRALADAGIRAVVKAFQREAMMNLQKGIIYYLSDCIRDDQAIDVVRQTLGI